MIGKDGKDQELRYSILETLPAACGRSRRQAAMQCVAEEAVWPQGIRLLRTGQTLGMERDILWDSCFLPK